MLFDLGRDAPFVESITLETASVGQSRGIEEANLGKSLIHHTRYIQSISTYHYAILAGKFIPVGRGSLTLVVKPSLFNAGVQYIEVEMINVITGKDIADEFHKRRLSHTCLSKKQDGVWPIRPVF